MQSQLNTKILALILMMLYWPVHLNARYNIHTIDSHNGLPSMFVFSAYQQDNGLLWFGTYDGLSVMSHTRQNLSFLSSITNQFNGCYVEGISEGAQGHIWIRSNIGISLIDLAQNQVIRYPEISGDYRYAVSNNDLVIVLTKHSGFQYYNNADKRFLPLPFQDISLDEFLFMHICDDDKWIVVTRHQTMIVELIQNRDGSVCTKLLERVNHPKELSYANLQDDQLFYINVDGEIIQSARLSKTLKRLGTLPASCGKEGISSFLKSGNTYFISYYNQGAYQLSLHQGEMSIDCQYLSCGVFRMHKDRHQPIIWMLTDGEGVKYLVDEPFRVHNETFNNLPFKLSAPIRVFEKDSNGRLWIGTKGNGIYCFEDYHPFDDVPCKVRQYTTDNSALLHNSVYSLVEDKHGIIWIGSDAHGINYINVSTGEIRTLAFDSSQMLGIHDIELSADGLWIASENGLFQIRLSWSGNSPSVVSCERVVYEKKQKTRALLQAVKEDAHHLWMASRERGLMHWNCQTKKSEIIAFSQDQRDIITDVCTVLADQPNYVYCGTRGGLVRCSKKDPNSFEFVSESLNVGNQSIRSLHSAGENEIWFTTHNEIVKYNPSTREVRYFTHSNGIDVMEYSDGASFYDPSEGVNYFGGTNAFVAVSVSAESKSNYTPSILYLCTENGDISPKLYSKLQQDYISLSHSQSDCKLWFFIPDNIDSDLYTLEYMLNDDGIWKTMGSDNTISFSNLNSQEYLVSVRYHKGSYVSETSSLTLNILPPWYYTWWMKLIYFLLLAAVVYYMVREYKRRLLRKQHYAIEESRQKAKQEEYESKLQFFEKMTQQLSNPLMLIGGPCERILYDNENSARTLQYAHVIQDNTKRLQNLLQQMMEIKLWNTEEQETPSHVSVPQAQDAKDVSINEEKYTILLAEPDAQMSWFISDLLSKDYNVLCCPTSDELTHIINTQHIDLIILDCSLVPIDGLEMCRQLKSDKSTNHIPLFMLSETDKNKAECMESGTQQFIQKPFDTQSFVSTVRGQMKRQNNLKQYYNSVESSFDVFQGKKMHREDKELLENIYRIIQDNLTDPNLSTKFVAEQVGMGVRNLYRKLEGLTDVMPKELIKEMRLTKAAKLLITTKMSMEEVFYSVGFSNKGTFYKLFAERYGCTPKQYKEKNSKQKV